jgi:hypothetical protein
MRGAHVAHPSEPTHAKSTARAAHGVRGARDSAPKRADACCSKARAAHRERGARDSAPKRALMQSLGTWRVRCAQVRRPAAGGSHQQQYAAHKGAYRAPDDAADRARRDTFATAVAASRCAHVATRAAVRDAGCARPAVDLAACTTARSSAQCARAAPDAAHGMRRDQRTGRRVHVTTRAAASHHTYNVAMRAAAYARHDASRRTATRQGDTFAADCSGMGGRKVGLCEPPHPLLSRPLHGLQDTAEHVHHSSGWAHMLAHVLPYARADYPHSSGSWCQATNSCQGDP